MSSKALRDRKTFMRLDASVTGATCSVSDFVRFGDESVSPYWDVLRGISVAWAKESLRSFARSMPSFGSGERT